jgi:hypothetical protein
MPAMRACRKTVDPEASDATDRLSGLIADGRTPICRRAMRNASRPAPKTTPSSSLRGFIFGKSTREAAAPAPQGKT